MTNNKKKIILKLLKKYKDNKIRFRQRKAFKILKNGSSLFLNQLTFHKLSTITITTLVKSTLYSSPLLYYIFQAF